MDTTTAIDRYFTAWNQRDEQARHDAVEKAWADDAVYIDPNGVFTGREAIAGMIGAVLGMYPGISLARTSVIDDNDRLVRFSWAIKNAGGMPLLTGVDFGEIAEDGRLSRIVGFFSEAALDRDADARPEIEVHRDVAAPREVVWPLLADHEAYGRIAPNLSKVEVIEGSGVGMVRQCAVADGKPWRETCTLWEEGHRYSFDIDTTSYPYPVKEMTGTWGVEDHDGGSRITMRFHLEPVDHPASVQFVRMMKTSFTPTLETILDHWQQQAEARA